MTKPKLSDEDVLGAKFNKLTILNIVSVCIITTKRPSRLVEYLCDCGKTGYYDKAKVVRGINKSCGCLIEHLRKTLGSKVKLSEGEASFNNVYQSYLKGARNRSLIFELTREDCKEIMLKNCTYCGSPPTAIFNRPLANGAFVYNGIDRVDNSKGYTIDNVTTCCKTCNIIKTNHSLTFLKSHIETMLSNIDNWQHLIK